MGLGKIFLPLEVALRHLKPWLHKTKGMKFSCVLEPMIYVGMNFPHPLKAREGFNSETHCCRRFYKPSKTRLYLLKLLFHPIVGTNYSHFVDGQWKESDCSWQRTDCQCLNYNFVSTGNAASLVKVIDNHSVSGSLTGLFRLGF